MKRNRLFLLSALIFMLLALLSSCSDDDDSDNLLKKAALEKPQGENHPMILRVQGTHYAMGYQQGYLLADHINEVFSRIVTFTAFQYHVRLTETLSFPESSRLYEIHSYMKKRAKAIYSDVIRKDAPELEDELRGMAAGLKEKGSKIDFDDLILMSAIPDVINNETFYAKFFELSDSVTRKSSSGITCSGIAAWGSATKDGRLLHGANLDFDTFGVLERHVIVMIAKPEKGYAFAGVVFPGLFALTGMNEKGLSVNEMTSEVSDADLTAHPQIPHVMRMRMLMQYADSAAKAESMIRRLGGGVGWNILVSDKTAKTAWDMECSAQHLGVIRPWDDPETPSVNESEGLCVTNQTLASPGFRGYTGENMTIYQMQEDGVDTSSWGNGADYLQVWKSYVDSDGYVRGESLDRWHRLWELFSKKYGSITAYDVIKFISDTETGPRGGTISDASEEFFILPDPVPHIYGPDAYIIMQGLSAIYSCVFEPESGVRGSAWIAGGSKPAQKGIFYKIDLDEQLRKLW